MTWKFHNRHRDPLHTLRMLLAGGRASNNAAVANKEEQTASYGGRRTGSEGRWVFNRQCDPVSIRPRALVLYGPLVASRNLK